MVTGFNGLCFMGLAVFLPGDLASKASPLPKLQRVKGQKNACEEILDPGWPVRCVGRPLAFSLLPTDSCHAAQGRATLAFLQGRFFLLLP